MLQQLAQLVVNGLITGTILALTGVGATLVFGIQRIANFAQGEYLTFGAYVGLLLNVDAGQSLPVATVGAPSWRRCCWPLRSTLPSCGRYAPAASWRLRS
jgi:branched-subunit amino acid ABC-type transport system permease component